MRRYDPARSPDPREWLALDESERIEMVERFHRESAEEMPADSQRAHAAVHVIVENQLAMEEESVPAAVARLLRQGLDRHEAIHAVGAVLLDQIGSVYHGGTSWDTSRYRKRLKRLTARRWKRGKC